MNTHVKLIFFLLLIFFQHQEWEKSYQHFGNYIQTKTKPQLFYLPAKHTPETEKKLQETKDKFRCKMLLLIN